MGKIAIAVHIGAWLGMASECLQKQSWRHAVFPALISVPIICSKTPN